MAKRKRQIRRKIEVRDTPENQARTAFALEQLDEIEQERQRTSVPISITSGKSTGEEVATSKENLLKRYAKTFPLRIELDGETHVFICQRKNIMDVLPERSPDAEVTDRDYYNDCVRLILDIVTEPKWTTTELYELPSSLVTRIARGIQDEIAPRFTEDNVTAPDADAEE